MTKQPLYPHVPGGKLPPHVTGPASMERYAREVVRERAENVWEIEFTATFQRLGRTKEEARANAEEYLEGIVVLSNKRIIRITPLRRPS